MSATSSSPTITQIFPTTTSSGISNNQGGFGGQNPTTYYFVFLGVLVVLLTIAATLSLRAFRIRRRYRTATQLAIMRGEPLPQLNGRDDMWGFGPMVWRGDDGPLGGAGGAGRRDDGKVKGAWKAVPKLMEREVDDDLETEGEKGDWILEECLPVTLHSLLPVESAQPPPITPAAPAPTSNRFLSRGVGATSRIDFIDMRRRQRERESAPPPVKTEGVTTELDRGAEVGEDVRVAIVIRMPRDPAEIEEEERRQREEESEYGLDGDERPGWVGGMELGVWEGRVGS